MMHARSEVAGLSASSKHSDLAALPNLHAAGCRMVSQPPVLWQARAHLDKQHGAPSQDGQADHKPLDVEVGHVGFEVQQLPRPPAPARRQRPAAAGTA